ncbi:hypothetical protein MP228_007679 [Amoeboaphelidium protococcarum]|nr:hypothetical protein MP228_007679 [Amoeboaphelidium protococcarum]
MAEAVHRQMEFMVPEMREFQEKGLFSEDEVQMIVQKRRDFEYSIAKTSVSRLDFLNYIEFEINLEKLRLKRKSRLNIKGKKSLTDYSIITHVQRLFEKACLRFPHDISMWLSYIEFCKWSKSYHVLSRAFAKAIQFNPRCHLVWIAAAKHEWDYMSNITACRIIFLRALRLCAHESLLWSEYFRMELLFYVKLQQRKRVLFSTVDVELSSSSQQVDNQAQGVDLNQLPGGQVQQQETENEDDARYFSGDLFEIIINNAHNQVVGDKLKLQQSLQDIVDSVVNKFQFLRDDPAFMKINALLQQKIKENDS